MHLLKLLTSKQVKQMRVFGRLLVFGGRGSTARALGHEPVLAQEEHEGLLAEDFIAKRQ